MVRAVSRSGPSGRSKTRAEHVAAGRVQIVVWLEAGDAALLAQLEAADPGEGSRSRVVRRAIRELATKK